MFNTSAHSRHFFMLDGAFAKKGYDWWRFSSCSLKSLKSGKVLEDSAFDFWGGRPELIDETEVTHSG